MIALVRQFLFKDFGLKLFSFGLALMIWFTVFKVASKNELASGLSLTPTENRVYSNLPVVILSSAEDVRSVKVNPKEVEVTVAGEAKILRLLKAQDIRVLVDLTGIGAAHDLRKRIEVSTPAGVTYVRAEPDEVQVIFPPKNG